ncbi:dynamin family protein [Paenibacillus sp. ACRRX]|uniref:dynamin family protein n=1 Tax=Paenibacillus sp. ACRRX TaxID=2918206 RepID=UPI001EF4EFCD|nr:dynamin family protein [Paenibacillus sp. ACRRX]MCG7406683.1 dynamin family protein [Paenibacillus sp. ACRRX]
MHQDTNEGQQTSASRTALSTELEEATPTPLGEVLKSWASQMANEENEAAARKLRELVDKERENMLMIAMCGHFSAGKSTVINMLCGKSLLPSSPIPTSANVVTVRYGTSRAEIYRRTEHGPSAIAEVVPLDRLEAVCKDGEQVERVSLYDEVSWLKAGAALLDTPGVDSTDDKHRAATEAAMHMADVVVYVTDYNHVQSELNFSFAKEVVEAGKPLIWIVNQIDKHREQEIEFERYRTDVDDALAAWGIHPAAIYYVSMREPDHPHNEWKLVTRALHQLVIKRERLVRYGIEQAARVLLAEHTALLEEPAAAAYEEWASRIGGEEQVVQLRTELQRCEEEYHLTSERSEHERDSFVDALSRLLRDANITPALLRDSAQSYLESRKPGFKVGLLFTAGKTEAERDQRLQRLVLLWVQEIQANITAHLVPMLRQLAERASRSGTDVVNELEASLPHFEAAWFANAVQTTSVGSGEYTMNYCRGLAEEAKSLIRKTVLRLADQYIEQIHKQDKQNLSGLEQQMLELQANLAIEAKTRQTMYRIQERHAVMLKQLEKVSCEIHSVKTAQEAMPDLSRIGSDSASVVDEDHPPEQTTEGTLAHLKAQDCHPAIQQDDRLHLHAVEGQVADDPMPTTSEEVDASLIPTIEQMSDKLQAAALHLESAAEVLEPLKLMDAYVPNLRAKAQRLRDNRFTVALFGAFSAGKSSFANALIGANVLPVSPNPTTAAINMIGAPTDQYPHQTALVRMKSESQLLADIQYALTCIGEPETAHWGMSEALQAVDRWQPSMLHPSGRPHYSFIHAVKRGYTRLSSLLGQELHVDYERYRQFVADESQSAFVDHVQLFVDSPWTRQGFTFVDTPGADSINARHTGVSFEYIKNADIVLFVTYYNHAFSQADRQFLTQLGRVKDAFELDKMFFLVNAADLASSSQELDDVMRYVGNRLLEFGIRSPRLCAISSLNALEAKLADDQKKLNATGFTQFETEFLHFASEELAAMAINSAVSDVERASGQLTAILNAARSDETERERRLQQLAAAGEAAINGLTACLEVDESRMLEQETEELLYHVRQRIQFRFSESFTYSFSPAALRSDDQDVERTLLQCYRDWQRASELELTNELLSTSLRLEQLAQRLVMEHYNKVAEQARQLLPGYEPVAAAMTAWPTPKIQIQHAETELTGKKLRSIYKNNKHFFEGSGRDSLKQLMEQIAVQNIMLTNQTFQGAAVDAAILNFKQTLNTQIQSGIESVKRYQEAMASAMREDVDTEQLEEMAAKLFTLVHEMS